MSPGLSSTLRSSLSLSLTLSLSLSRARSQPLCFMFTVEYSSRRYLFQKISRQMGRVDAPVEKYDSQNWYIYPKWRTFERK